MRRVAERDLPMALRVEPVSDNHGGSLPSASGRHSKVLEAEGAKKKRKEREHRTDSCQIERQSNKELLESPMNRTLRRTHQIARQHSHFSHSVIRRYFENRNSHRRLLIAFWPIDRLSICTSVGRPIIHIPTDRRTATYLFEIVDRKIRRRQHLEKVRHRTGREEQWQRAYMGYGDIVQLFLPHLQRLLARR